MSDNLPSTGKRTWYYVLKVVLLVLLALVCAPVGPVVVFVVYFLPKSIDAYKRDPDAVIHALDYGMGVQIFGVIVGIAVVVFAIVASWTELRAGEGVPLVFVLLTALVGPFIYYEGVLWAAIPVNTALRQLHIEGKHFSRDKTVNRVRRHVRRHRVVYRLLCLIARTGSDHLDR